MDDLLNRLRHWQTTTLGAVAAGAVLTVYHTAPMACQQWIQNYHAWGGAAVLFLWGAYLKGPGAK